MVVAAIGHPFIALGIAASTIISLARRLQSMPDRWLISLRLAGLGHLHAVRAVLESAVRTWWPITFALCIASQRARRVVTVFIVTRAFFPTSNRTFRGTGDLDPLRSTGVQVLDDVAYGAGVWFAAIKIKRVECLLPRLD